MCKRAELAFVGFAYTCTRPTVIFAAEYNVILDVVYVANNFSNQLLCVAGIHKSVC